MAKGVFAFWYVFSPHIYSRVLISTRPVLSNGTCFMQLERGEQKRATKNRTPIAQDTIEPSANNGFSARSGKKLQLERLELNSRLIGL